VLLFALVGVAAKVNTTPAAGADCDSNAIVYCGVSQGSLASKYHSLDGKGKAAFAHAGVNPSQLGQTVVGTVTRDNKVIVNGRVVATNVYTYGRSYMSGSTQISGGAYMRHPSVSFRSPSLTAYVHMNGDRFEWAVIASCGNPVKGTPTANPRVTIQKTANKSVVKPGETFNYSVTVRNTGNVALRNVVVRDVLPTGLEPVGLNPGVTYNASTRRITWPTVAHFPAGSSFVRTFKVKVAANAEGRKVNIACVITNYNPTLPICDDVPVTIIKDKPKVKIVKDVNASTPVDVNQEFTYTIRVTNIGNVKLTNAKITDRLPDHVIAVDNPNSRTVTFLINSLNPGETKTRSFKAKALASAPIDTKLKNVACVDTDQTDDLICDDADIKIKKPVYSCDALTSQKLAFNKFRFNLSFTARNGATLKNAAYDFGDNSPVVNTTDTSVEHTYAQPGEYTARAVLTFTVNGEDKVVESDKCKVQVKVAPPKVVCEALGAATVDADGKLPFNITFNAQASASNGAVIEGYLWNFGDGQTAETAGSSTSHAYTQAGTFTATVQVKSNIGTTPVSAACSFKVEVPEEPEEPIYTCDSLTIKKLGELKYQFSVDYTAENGATLKNVAYNFGDNSPVVNTTDTTVEHTYAEAGEYTAEVNLTFTVNGEDKVVTSAACKATTDKPPVEPKCPYPGKEHLPKDSPDCKEDVPPETPPEEVPPTFVGKSLPDTGPADIAGVFASTVLAGMIAYRFVWLRRYN